MVGKRIGERYEVKKYIGGGGMSRVYLAHDIILDRNVAIKVLNYDFSNEEELKRRFLREALSATSLTHPNIVDIFDVGEDGEIYYLVMEYVEGQTLKEYIVSQGPLSADETILIMKQLVSAIANAHYNGIVHRDIKPQNILMDLDGNVKITDFGIAMALSATAYTKTNSVLGTVHYLSPEQARGGMATKKSDIYSLGIVLYELLSGKLPFSGESAVSIALKHLQEETPSIRSVRPEIPQSLENIILKATAKDAANRYQSADEMQEDLATALNANRINEAPFTAPYDDQQTKAIPIIKEEQLADSEATKLHTGKDVAAAKEPSKKKRKKWPLLFIGISALALIAIVAYLLVSFYGTKQAEIPDVVGMLEAEAIKELEDKGFIVEESIEEPSEEFEAGLVTKTSPEAGRKRDVGTEIKLYVSIGKEKIVFDRYVGQDYNQVVNILDKLGFKTIKEEKVFSDEREGIIVSQTPEAGIELIPSETDLVFQVSKGKDIRTLQSLVGMNQEELQKFAKESGFNITIVREEFSSSIEKGRVISQNPSANAKLEKGETVEVVLSKGINETPAKHVVKTINILYTGTIEEPGEDGEEPTIETPPQTIRIYVQDRNRTMAEAVEEFVITENTTRRITIELEQGQQGAYKVTRDSSIIAEQSFNYSDAN